MNSLDLDTLSHLGEFLNPNDAVSLSVANSHLQNNSDILIKNQYQKLFGKISENQEIDQSIMTSLVYCADKSPDALINHNVYRMPSNRLDRWKWIVGLNNSLDREVQETYDNRIKLLDNTQATSITQLKMQLQTYWHINRQVKDYKSFKSDQTHYLSGSFFFKCVKFFMKSFYPSVIDVAVKKNLEQKSDTTFAKIGSFQIEEKNIMLLPTTVWQMRCHKTDTADMKTKHIANLIQNFMEKLILAFVNKSSFLPKRFLVEVLCKTSTSV